MGFQNFMNKVRYLDNRMAKWILRHFYILFFEVLLIFVFLLLFVNTIKVINVGLDMVAAENFSERLLYVLTINSLVLVFLLLLNSFWMLFIFRSVNRMQSGLREVNFNLTRLRGRARRSES